MQLVSIYVLTLILRGKLGANMPKQHLEWDIWATVVTQNFKHLMACVSCQKNSWDVDFWYKHLRAKI